MGRPVRRINALPEQGSVTGSGLVVVDKAGGWTSHQVVGRLRRILGTRKVGHAGTLDPMATGVLLVGINRATRLLGHLMLTQKSYSATIRLGESTVTDDAEGEPVDAVSAEHLDDAAITATVAGFVGDIDQVPSAVSAVKVNGVRAYAKVRAGEDVVLAPRRVTVSRYDVLEFRRVERPGRVAIDVDVQVDCSSGTYIRALARDLGSQLGVGGHLTRLRRTRVGPFGLDRAELVDADTEGVTVIDIAAVARSVFPAVELEPDAALAARRGRRRDPITDATGLTAVFDDAEFIGLYRPDGRPEAIFVGS